MAYTHTLHWNGADGSKSQDSGVEYDAIYRVTTDDAQDQSQKVIEWFEENVVEIGDPYEYANDEDENAVAKSIKAVREKGSTDIWIVSVRYSPVGPGEFQFEFITEELPLRCEDLSMQTIQHQKPVEKAKYRGGFVGTAAAKVALGTTMIPSNSAFVPFNPGLEMDVAGLSVRIVRRLPGINGTYLKTLMNSVNSESFTVNHCGFILSVEPYQARIVSGHAAVRSEDGNKYWELPISMEIIDEGWRDEVVDRGTAARGCDTDVTGRGGTISGNDPGYHIPGVPKLRELVDTDETPISDPVLFDGDGQPLDICVTQTPVYITYQKYLKEIAFQGVPYFNGLVF